MQCSGALWSFVDNEPHAKLPPHSLGQKKISENPPAGVFFLLVEMETNCVPAVTARGDTDGDQGTQERDPRI